MAKKKKTEEVEVQEQSGMSLVQKKKRLDAIAEGINSKYKKQMVGKLSDPNIQELIKIDFIPSASPEFNKATGGFPIGKVSIVNGAADSGKTSLILNSIGYNMEHDESFTALWLESESSLDLEYIRDTFHIDLDRFYYIPMQRERGGEEALDDLESMVSTGAINMCVINTLRALIPISEIQKTMKEVDVAQSARMNSRFMGKIVPLIADTKTALVIVQQRTTQIGGFSGYGDKQKIA